MLFDKLHIGYKESLLHIEHLELKAGQLVALIGANGKGKSTLLKTIMGEIKPLKGRITVDNQELHLLKNKERAKIVSMVPSKFPGVPFMSGMEFLQLGRTPHTNAFGKLVKADQDAIDEWTQTLKVEHLLEKMTLEMSDGERQLLAICRALIQDTPYILLDEPVAFLDYANKKKILALLQSCCAQSGKTILFSSHDLELTLAHEPALWCIPSDSIELNYFDANKLSLDELVQVCFG